MEDANHIRELLGQRIDALEASVSKSEQNLSKRLESMNEIRDAMKDQADRMATRTEVDRLEIRLRGLENSRSLAIGWSLGIAGIVSVIISVLGVVVRMLLV